MCVKYSYLETPSDEEQADDEKNDFIRKKNKIAKKKHKHVIFFPFIEHSLKVRATVAVGSSKRLADNNAHKSQ